MYIGIKEANKIPEGLRKIEGVEVHDGDSPCHIIVNRGVLVYLSGDHYRIGNGTDCILLQKELVNKLDVY